MRWWLKSFVLGSFIAWIIYYRLWTYQLIRTRTKGLSYISSSLENNTEQYYFYNRSQQLKSSYFECENRIYAHGPCGNLQISPLERPCTPPIHIHLNQTEYFTLIQGHLGYQLNDKIYSCNIHTCPKPLIIPPRIPHTFWMNDNKEDLVVLIRAEPANRFNGLRQEFFENLAGVLRDDSISIWQIFVLFENAQTYPASLPLPIMKIIVKVGAIIGRILGFKQQYEEYTTTTDEIN
ncbi:unnamed protein product [Adineta steineri]|uniref:Cupin 2 conserved barrel domain-containing protein n=1 Tax=Adineta steineri TaxID=433720 RepID=A0A814CLI1_9BILA|nr:unnamed protein product [Adineta steineri]CAF4179206.1 unnamed protein product [Adineta steineri]